MVIVIIDRETVLIHQVRIHINERTPGSSGHNASLHSFPVRFPDTAEPRALSANELGNGVVGSVTRPRGFGFRKRYVGSPANRISV